MKITSLIAILPFLLAACEKPDSGSAETASAQPAEETAYPLDVCVVSGEALGSMGEPIVIQHEGREVRFCCEHCLPEFKANPEKYLSKLDAAAS